MSVPMAAPISADICRGTKRVIFSYVEEEMHHVAVLDDVGLALQPHLAGLLRSHLAVEAHVLVIGDDLGADEDLLEISVDRAGSLRCGSALEECPVATIVLSVGE